MQAANPNRVGAPAAPAGLDPHAEQILATAMRRTGCTRAQGIAVLHDTDGNLARAIARLNELERLGREVHVGEGKGAPSREPDCGDASAWSILQLDRREQHEQRRDHDRHLEGDIAFGFLSEAAKAGFQSCRTHVIGLHHIGS